eukprot:1143588-Pelagomonas_calceolata.AAC.1
MAFEILKSFLGASSQTPSWSVLRECGTESIQFNRQRKLSLHQLRKERHIGSKSRESPSPEDERGVFGSG